MKYYKLYFIFLLVLLLSINSISAGPVLNQQFSLTTSCGGFNCSNLNITILYPNSSTFVNNQQMTNNIFYANYTFTPLTLGTYIYYLTDGTLSNESSFVVTNTGYELSTAQGILYSLVGMVLIFLFLLSLYGAIVTPFKNSRSVNNEVVKINWKKYLKIFCWFLSYMFLIGIVFVTWNLIYAYSDWQNLGKFFHYTYRLLMLFFLPTLIGIWLIGVINYVNDKKIEEFIKRTGLNYNG